MTTKERDGQVVEEVKEEVQEEAQTEEVEVVEETYTEDEKVAMSKGWQPLEAWKADGRNESDWRPAKEFNDRGELLDHIHGQNRQIKALRESFSALQLHQANVSKLAYDKAMRDLKREKRAAMVEDDFETVDAIENQIEETQEEFAKAQEQLIRSVPANTGDANPEFQQWTSRNRWYGTNKEMKTFADAAGLAYHNNNPGVTPDKVLAHVEREVKNRFPKEFGIVRRSAPDPVGRPSKQGAKGPAAKEFPLTDLEKDIMDKLVKRGHMTKDEYISQLKQYKEQ